MVSETKTEFGRKRYEKTFSVLFCSVPSEGYIHMHTYTYTSWQKLRFVTNVVPVSVSLVWTIMTRAVTSREDCLKGSHVISFSLL